MVTKQGYVIDGQRFSTLEEFFAEVDRVLIPSTNWGRNLDAFNDILSGGFGTPDEGFVLRWRNSDVSTARLGYAETVRQLQIRRERADPSNLAQIEKQIADAKHGIGQTIFECLVEIINDHGPDGTQSEDGVELILD